MDKVDKVNKKNQSGHLEVVQFLLSKGADCTIKDKWGDTPLESARGQGHHEVVALLG